MLKGKNIILRPLKMSDWEKTIHWRNNITIKKMAMMHPFPITEMVEKEWYENIMKSKDDGTVYFTITKGNDEPIGFLTLNKINQIHRNCYLGIVIGEPEAQGKGFGSEATKIAMEYAFNTLNLNKITLEVVEHNESALKLYRKLGFVEEGRLKQHYYSDGKYFDVLILSVFNNIKH
jgi:UDP-4-amino-4,6-dideoxy-N-acetyl-beta-L-altrosamine N-acetyltransferase